MDEKFITKLSKQKTVMRILLYGDCYNDRISQGLDYLLLMYPYGDVTLITPDNISDRLLKEYDVLVLPGGADVDPRRYGEKPHIFTGRANTQYEYMDLFFLPDWIATGKPIIGICRGIQTLNVAMGGTLYQHIWGHMGNTNNRPAEHHKIYTDIVRGEEDYRIYGVNSFHHQSVKRLADGFEIIGWSTVTMNCPSFKDKYMSEKERPISNRWVKNKETGKITKDEKSFYFQSIEIVKHKERPYLAFQYHPENMNCPLFHYLVSDMLSHV